jgi:hypothetical protein
MTQTLKEIIDWTNAFWTSDVDCENFVNPTQDQAMGYEFGKFIYHNFAGVYSFQSLEAAFAALKSAGKLKRKYKPKSPAEIAAERAQALDASNMAIATSWMRDICPTGLIFGADLFAGDSDKVMAFLRTKYDFSKTPLSYEMLNEAIVALAGSLTWKDRSPAAMQFRGAYAPQPPKPKQLSEKALIESGQKSDPSMRRSHADDKPLISMAETAEQAKRAYLKVRGIEDPEIAAFRIKAEAISVSNHLGKLDHVKTAELRQIFAKNPDGSVNWKVTYDWRWKAADQIERLKGRR